MLQKLKHSTHYTHVWDFFSKMLLLSETALGAESIAHIVSTIEEQKKCALIANELWIPYYILTTYHDLERLSNSSGCIYSICISEIENDFWVSWLENMIYLELWETISMEDLMKKLQDLEYEFSEYEKPGTYSRVWDQIKIYFPDSWSVSLSFWWDEIESISWGNNEELSELRLSALTPLVLDERHNTNLIEYFKEQKIFCILDMLQFHYLYETLTQKDIQSASLNILSSNTADSHWHNLQISPLNIQTLEELKETLWSSKSSAKIYTRHVNTISEFFEANNFWHISITWVKTHLLTSFSYPQKQWKNWIYICDDILSKIFIKKRVRKKLSADVDLLLKIANGDYIVHIDHGIGLFQWIVKKQLWNITKEYLEISYKEKDKLFVPITEVHRVSKYIWSENPKLTPLSGKIWEKKMAKVHEDIQEIAEDILKNFAERKLRAGKQNILSTAEIKIFHDWFPYSYTQDQAQGIDEIFTDMQSDKNMDRLLVWDVGFWKTEVAFNAAYCALKNKKQVLLISPLVVLAHEHFIKTQQRFREFGYNIEVLTRLQSQKHATMVIKWLADGSIDMVVGTHRLLSDKLRCKNLGLMIVDEEHKFGVVDKEKIKNIKSDIDILSLSATPIPRSLNLALSWVRDISILKTPPTGRKSIETSVLRYNEQLIYDAGKRELNRGGQIFFVHNRVATIEVFKKKLEALFPKKKVIITHGQLQWDELENRILDFKNKKYDILLSTTVIENGIDFSNVNTIFINECQQFGISQIHQLRGRVWRSDTQWYCYLLYRKEHLDGEAAKRIQTIVDYSYLWAGFELAMKDLEIRGGGDILGVRQSGQAREIGVSLFLKMLEEKIEDLKQKKASVGNAGMRSDKKQNIHIQTQIDLMISAGIPDSYFLSETDKLNFYREIEMIQDIWDLEFLKNSFFESSQDTFEIPEETQNLFSLLECQILSGKYKITLIKKIWLNYQIAFHQYSSLDDVKWFLKLDKDVKFRLIDATKLRCKTKDFVSDTKFIEYLLQLLQWNIWNKKIRLVRKA